MGGYVIDTTEDIYTEHHGRFVLTPRGVAWVLENYPDLMPDVSEEEIEDRSKADTFAKLLSLSQVLFFCVSCTDRGVKHLPLTLIEVLTLAHALCTVFTYLVWFKKPFSIMEPTVLVGDSAELRAATEYLIKHTPNSVLNPRQRGPPRSTASALLNGRRRRQPRRAEPADSYTSFSGASATDPFATFPCLAREASLTSTSLTNKYNGLALDPPRAGALGACMVLYALPLFLGWHTTQPAELTGLWRGCALALLLAGLAQALVLARVLEPTACRGDDAPLALCVVWLYALLMVGSLVGYAVAGFVAALAALVQLLDLPPGALVQTPVFKYWPHLS